MAHEVEKMAFIGDTPWHGLGSRLTPGADLETWEKESGLDWGAVVTPIKYQYNEEILTSDQHCVVVRSDTGSALGVVSNRYKPVQPEEVIEFYRDLTESYGFELETAGCLKNGQKIWALANTGNSHQLRGGDEIRAYLLLATSFDRSIGTQARFTSVRVVCNNTLGLAVNDGDAEVAVRHNTVFDADQVKIGLQVGSAWENHVKQVQLMSQRIVSQQESVNYLLDVYYGLKTEEQIEAFHDDKPKSCTRLMNRLQKALFESPGSDLPSAKGTLWGLVNAVTYDIDHSQTARTADTRLDSAWFGRGNVIKTTAWDTALKMVA